VNNTENKKASIMK